ncbi:MAG: sugar transferase [Candidatus Omnitrophica bacterium]|nr:sugar transferase [Smithellaceae bacterium]MDD5670895.1 sugar transferase [Candidatus Omnitrophota bacterium]
MPKWLLELKDNSLQMRKALEIDLMLRRYEMIKQGKDTWEDQIAGFWIAVQKAFVSSWRLFIKRALDVSASLAGIVLTLPVMTAVAVAIRLDSKGPIVYSQTRVGLRGKHFNMYKFRTMRQDAEVASGPVWAKENDPRVTKVGNFLRKTHLDEIPQLLNVLRGEMSLVGPRPERPYFVNEFRKMIPHYTQRLCAKPGITGLAQIKRHYDETIEDVKRKLRYDRLYIQKMCPFLDVKVILMTVMTVVLKTGR